MTYTGDKLPVPFCDHCGGFHYPSTAGCVAWYSIIVPMPEKVCTKMMPCGHSGLLIKGKWVCQTCMSWAVKEFKD